MTVALNVNILQGYVRYYFYVNFYVSSIDFRTFQLFILLGFKLSTPALSSLVLRYANRKGRIMFDDFLQICCRIRSCFGRFQYFDIYVSKVPFVVQ